MGDLSFPRPSLLALVADDNRAARRMLRLVLEPDGYEVTEAENGAQALDLFTHLRPDLVLLDAMMPVMNGFRACAAIRALPGGADVPILIITALDDNEAVEQAFAVGATDFVTKPVRLYVLRHRIRHLLRQRRAEQALQASEQRYRALFERTNDAVFFIGLDGIILTVNQRAADVLGYETDRLPGMRMQDIVVPREYDDLQEKLEILLGYQTLPIYERTFRKKDGTELPIEVNAALVCDDDNNPLHVQSIVRDITERRRLERLRAEFVSTVSHELRTPLTSVLGFTETLLDGSAGPLTETQREFLEFSYDSGKQLLRQVNDLLDVGRLESDRLMLQMEQVELPALLRGVIQGIGSMAEKKKIDVTLDVSEVAPLFIEVDRHRLEQIVNNLLANAVKFTPAGGRVTLTLRVTLAGRVLDGRQLWGAGAHLQIQDTGIGIPPEDLPHLFERFHRGSNVMGRSFEGTGLGLHIARGLVEAHHGCIWAESQIGVGAMFHVWLPVRQHQSFE